MLATLGQKILVQPYSISSLFQHIGWVIGADSVVAVLETVVIALAERFPGIVPHRTSLLWGCCIVLFLLGLPMCTGVILLFS